MAALRFETYDVFADRIFGGNPLAVFFDGDSLDDESMQRIAREMNLSETTFVIPTEDPARFVLRIFTPATELPFAGHPTLGSAVAIARGGGGSRDAKGEAVDLVLVERAGDVPVRVSLNADGDPISARLRAPRPPFLEPSPHGRSEIAAVIGLDEGRFHAAEMVTASVGTPFLCVRLNAATDVDAAAVDLNAFASHVEGRSPDMIYIYAFTGEREVYARMFAPAAGIAEDPATGSAAAAFGAIAFEELGGEGVVKIRQGVRMGRPSELLLELETSGGALEAVFVTGGAVRVMEGRMHLDAGEVGS